MVRVGKGVSDDDRLVRLTHTLSLLVEPASSRFNYKVYSFFNVLVLSAKDALVPSFRGPDDHRGEKARDEEHAQRFQRCWAGEITKRMMRKRGIRTKLQDAQTQNNGRLPRCTPIISFDQEFVCISLRFILVCVRVPEKSQRRCGHNVVHHIPTLLVANHHHQLG